MPHGKPKTPPAGLVRFTNLDKVLYPDSATTKGDVIAYYAIVGPFLIRHARRRPATVRRWVEGVGSTSAPLAGFFQKDLPKEAPIWVPRVTLEHRTRSNTYPLVDDEPTLAWLAQLAALEIHTPQWRVDAAGERQHPDRLVIDLDPGDGVDLRQCADVARLARAWLVNEGFQPVPVTSGSKGIHLYSALDGSMTTGAASDLAQRLARELESERPDLVVSSMARERRRGKVFIDWSQNNGAKTMIAPYSLRGTATPMVAAPRTWRELASPTIRHLNDQDVIIRLRKGRGDLLSVIDAGTSVDDGDAPATGEFVIQEHHARRHHFDLRLQHRGTLESWSLPRGVPTEAGREDEAVYTGTRSLTHSAIEGEAESSGYLGGTVSTWDKGTFDVHTWHDGEEVVVTLHGGAAGGLKGDLTIGLTHTGRAGRDDDQWRIHVMGGRVSTLSPTIPFPPMLAAALGDDDLAAGDWYFEMKWDGVRALCEVRGGSARLWSRNGTDLTDHFPEVAADLPAALRGDAVIDGEIVTFDATGRPSFPLLQERLGTSARNVARRATQSPAHLMAFDVLEAGGELLIFRPYRERREHLEGLVSQTAHVHVPPVFDRGLEEAIAVSHEHGLEGVVAKQSDSPYLPGRRSTAWRKVKHVRSAEVIIVGWLNAASGGLGSLVLAVPEVSGALRYAGKVGAGLSERQRGELTSALLRIAGAEPLIRGLPRGLRRDVRWVEPTLVGEVQFTEWTRGGSLRHPSWRGLRHDKTVADVQPPDDVA